MNTDGSENNLMTCAVCFNDLPQSDFFVLELCRCCFCRNCIVAHTEHEISNGKFRIPCPDGNCSLPGVLLEREIRYLVSGEIFARYNKILQDAKETTDPGLVFCPAPSCGDICVVDPSGPGKVVCSRCSTTFCRLCSSAWHEEKTCEEYSNPTACFSELGIRRCPECKVPVQKAFDALGVERNSTGVRNNQDRHTV